MSKENIIAQGWASKDEYIVTFRTRDGVRSYQYDRVDGLQIMAGSDPHNFNGQEVSTMTAFQDLAENVEDLAEIAEVLL